MLCFCLSAFWMSCEKAEIQKSAKDDTRISARIDECADCDEGDCCCGAQLLSYNTVHLTLCGTTSPDVSTNTCGGSSGSCSVSGYELYITLTDHLDKGLFCMGKSSAFSITSDAAGTVRVSCQNDQIGAQYQDLVFPNGGGTYYYSVNSGCYVLGCH